jgi:hypothetical protein
MIRLVLNDDTTYIKIRYQPRSTLRAYFTDDNLAIRYGIKNRRMIVAGYDSLTRYIPVPELPDGCEYDNIIFDPSDFDIVRFKDSVTLHFELRKDANCYP